jgi:4-hydroxybenzoate polyprenyltransferase
MTDKKRSLLDYIFVLRPILLVPAWTMVLAGFHRSQGEWVISLALPGRLWLALLLFSGVMGAAYIVNQIFDVETDRLNRKLFLVAEGYVDKKAIIVEAILLLGLSIGAAFVTFQPKFGMVIVLSGLLGLLYSVPPFKLKARPFLDMLANGLGYGLLAFAVGWLSSGRQAGAVWQVSLPYVLAVSAVYLNTTIPDYQSDKATGNVTTGVWLGPRATRWLALAMMSGSLTLSIAYKDPLCLAASALALPLFLMAVITAKMRWTMLAYQAGSLVLVVLTAILYPIYLLILLATYFALKYYHRWRFGMDYPKFADRA